MRRFAPRAGTPLLRHLARLLLLGAALWIAAIRAFAAPANQEIAVLTSFPEDFARAIADAFKREHPGIEVQFIFKSTNAAIDHVMSGTPPVPAVVWMSSPLGIDLLMQGGHLAPHTAFTAPPSSIPPSDAASQYAFAYSRYGIMWRPDLLDARHLPAPRSWADLTGPSYRNEIAMSSPARSGTTQLFVEAVLQSEGWTRGWALLQELGGNLATVTARSFGVREGLLRGRFSVGIGIDFFARSTAGTGTPLTFLASPPGYLLPASAALLSEAKGNDAARAFIEFLRSGPGQEALTQPVAQRITLEAARAEAATDAGAFKPFDAALAAKRRGLVAVMFDQLITYRLDELKLFWTALHETEAAFARAAPNAPGRAEAADLLAKARAAATTVPVGDFMTTDDTFTAVFNRPASSAPDARGIQSRLQEEWAANARDRLSAAGALVAKARAALGEGQPAQTGAR